MQSRRGKFCDLEGVGLAIVVALEKKDEPHGAVRADDAFGSRSSGRSNPIPVKWPENSYRNSFEIQNIKRKSPTIFDISPVRFGSIITFPCSDVLNSCHLCAKKLHGKDIYMYRGEKAFCSAECRSRQIVIDERREKCTSEALRSVDVSNSPTTDCLALSTRITAI